MKSKINSEQGKTIQNLQGISKCAKGARISSNPLVDLTPNIVENYGNRGLKFMGEEKGPW